MSIYYFSKNSFVIKLSGENEIPNFFLKSDFFSKIRFFSRKHTKFGVLSLLYTTFRKHTKSGVWSLSEFPCFIVYAARNILSISDTMWCKARFVIVCRSTQTELRKRIYADMRVMAFILLYRSRRVSTQTYAIAVCVPFHGDGLICYVA